MNPVIKFAGCRMFRRQKPGAASGEHITPLFGEVRGVLLPSRAISWRDKCRNKPGAQQSCKIYFLDRTEVLLSFLHRNKGWSWIIRQENLRTEPRKVFDHATPDIQRKLLGVGYFSRPNIGVPEEQYYILSF